MKRFIWLLVLLVPFVITKPASAMPNFARATGWDCSGCHTRVPKLNKVGYEFRLAGLRAPNSIGVSQNKIDFGELNTARIQAQLKYKKHQDVNQSKDSTVNSLEFYEFTMYPLTGSWGGNYGSETEFSMAPDDVFEIENAYIRVVKGNEDSWWQARFGVMHPWEGFGASDRPIGLSRPLFQKSAAVGSPFFLWNLDEVALEVGHYSAKSGFTVAGRVSNGIIWKEDGSGAAEPAQGGALSKPTTGPGRNSKSFQFYADKFLSDTSSVSVYYYTGAVPFPDPGYEFTDGTTLDTFNRLAVYANYWIAKNKLNALVGYETGDDSLDDKTISSDDSKYNGANVGSNTGYFVEADYHNSAKSAFGVRMDQFDPSDKVSKNSQSAVSFFYNHSVKDGLQLICDWQHKETEKGASGKNKDDQFLARVIFIY